MFEGTSDKLNPERKVLMKTYHLYRYDQKIRKDDAFMIVLLKCGSITAKIDDHLCHFESPVIICLDELKQMKLLANSSTDVKIIVFDPMVMNVNMKMKTIRNFNYIHLCEQHSFFQLSPFLTKDINKIAFNLSDDTLSKIDYSFNRIAKILEEQPDVYWSCQARSYFIDIVSILERIYYNYYIIPAEDFCVQAKISQEFKQILVYINNHLEQNHTLDSLYMKFSLNRNLIEGLFKQYLGITFYDYLCKRRFEEASYYLRFTELTGQQIANRVGFSTSQNFCRFFKKNSGKTPNQFRREAVTQRRTDQDLIKLLNDSSCYITPRRKQG